MFGKPQKKRSFFEKLTGAVSADEFDDEFEIEERRAIVHADDEEDGVLTTSSSRPTQTHTTPDGDGQLAVDVINTDDSIIVRAMLAGVKPGEIDIDIARDMVTIRGTREEEHESITDDFYHRELFWGTFSRNIILPEEIDVELAEATEKHGLLTLRLPKVDKNRRQKLHVKSR
jgi:HSP20 family molecular chaperone IbpA